MFKRTVSADDLARLRSEREEADVRYNDALTALDRALPGTSGVPEPVPRPDDHQVAALNDHWTVLEPDPLQGLSGWRGRLAGFVWRLVGPVLQRQQAFNAAVVDHVNRNLPVERETSAALDRTLGLLHNQVVGLLGAQGRLIGYLQQITAYVDTKDREVVGLMRRINEDTAETCDLMDHRTVGLAAGLSGLGDEMLKRWESIAARQERLESRVAALTDDERRGLGEVQVQIAALQQSSTALKRVFERLAAARSPDGTDAAAATGERPARADAPAFARSGPANHEFGAALDSYKYVGFEDCFRGSQEEIRARLMAYLPSFAGARDVLDLGCGRGEFLDLLRQEGIPARGVDLNHEMAEGCRERGLDVVQGDGVAYLASLPDGALGGLFAAQVVEHLQPDQLLRLLEVAYDKLRPGSTIVLETINPTCWSAFFESYIRDVTHVRPLHPDTLQYLLQASGYQRVAVRYSAPYPEQAKLHAVAMPAGAADAPIVMQRLADLAEICNANVQRLNALLFGARDYAAVGVRA